MPVYRLTPIHPEKPSWAASRIRCRLIVRERSEQAARRAAADYAVREGLIRGAPSGKSLWERAETARIELVSESSWPRFGRPGVLGREPLLPPYVQTPA